MTNLPCLLHDICITKSIYRLFIIHDRYFKGRARQNDSFDVIFCKINRLRDTKTKGDVTLVFYFRGLLNDEEDAYCLINMFINVLSY